MGSICVNAVVRNLTMHQIVENTAQMFPILQISKSTVKDNEGIKVINAVYVLKYLG